MKILIAEDDTTSRLLFAATLRKLGHTVTAIEDGRNRVELSRLTTESRRRTWR